MTNETRETTTSRITYRWVERNRIGEPLPIARYVRETADNLLMLPPLPDESLPTADYPYGPVLTENRLTWRDVGRMVLGTGLGLVILGFALVGFVVVCQWIGGRL